MDFEALKLLAKYCPTQNNWILQLNYEQIIGHKNRTVRRFDGNKLVPSESELPSHGLTHIFFNYMTECQLVAMIMTRDLKLILINNRVEIEQQDAPENDGETNGEDGEEVIRLKTKVPLPKIIGVESCLTIIDNHRQLLNRQLIPNTLQKATGLKEWSKHLDQSKKKPSTTVDHLFISMAKESEQVALLEDWVRKSGKTLDFTHQYSIDEKQLSRLPEFETVEAVILSQNCQIRDFSWLKKFPLLTHLSLDQCQQIDEETFGKICKSANRLESVTLKFCCSVNIRIFLSLLNMSRLMRITIDYPNFYCQVSAKEVMISREEWRSLHSFTLQSLFLNSENLTLDVLDYILKACPSLRDVYLNDRILKMVSKNVMSDDNDGDVVNFHMASDFRKGFRVNRPMTFKNMFKNYITAPFSKTMLERMQQQERGNKEMEETINTFIKAN